MFYGFDYSYFLNGTNQERLKCLADGINYVLGFEEEERKDFITEATALSQAKISQCSCGLYYFWMIEN